MTAYQNDRYKYSNYHYGVRNQTFSDFTGDVSPASETIRSIVEYGGFLIKLTHPNDGHLWYVTDKAGKAIADIEGRFTKLQLAYDAIDRYLNDIQQLKREFMERHETRQNNNQTLQGC